MAKSIARHHAEWLSLVEVSGPFLSMPVLQRVFPQGLDAHEPEHFAELRQAHEEWETNQGGSRPEPATHYLWVKYVLAETLGFPEDVILEGQAIPQGLQATVSEHGEILKPDIVVRNPDDNAGAGKHRLLVCTLPAGQGLEKLLAGKRWKASPATRMMELLHATEVRLGLVTNGEQWMLVDAPLGETTGFASWYASVWLDEHITLRAFRSLLGARRFFGVPDDETLEAMLAESASNQQEVTDQLGYQVRRAVEVVVQTIDREDKTQGGTLLENVPETLLYEAALTVMMRLVFLFSAEERGLFLLGDELYDENYAVSTLRAQLRESADQHGEEILERRKDAWCRLLATFRAICSGVQHDRMRLPAYGGRLFDPDRYPFLEGRQIGTSWHDTAADPLPIDNRTVLHLLDALQILQVRVPGGGPAEARRLSFRALDIEQIGHVYENLLDHTAVRATGPVLGLAGTRDKEPEIALADLERLRAGEDDELVAFLKKETGRSPSAIKKALAAEPDLIRTERLRVACENDDALYRRVLPFAELVRDDTFDHPVIIPEGSVYVTAGTDRRTSGTHYTPRSLTEPIVQHTLDPLVYEGPADGVPKDQWKLKKPGEILDLKVCDMAMGSGAFLVQACRYLSEHLVESCEIHGVNIYELAGPEATPPVVSPPASNGAETSARESEADDERLVLARRLVCDRCLYGVDINPLAVDMAKLSLWLITLDKNRSFTFLDHALKHGDSLLGCHSRLQLVRVHIAPDTLTAQGKQMRLTHFNEASRIAFSEALRKRRELEAFTVNGIEDSHRKRDLLREADNAMAVVRLVGDAVTGAAIYTADGNAKKRNGEAPKAFDDLIDEFIDRLEHAVTRADEGEREAILKEWQFRAREMLNAGLPAGKPDRRPFHWPAEFPEVFEGDNPGFDAVVGNPPFLGGKRITGPLGTDYRNYLIDDLGNGQRGHADLCAYFYLQAGSLLRRDGIFALIATNTIAQGDTREVGLDQLVEKGFSIPRAEASRKWPGVANLEVAVGWLRKGKWSGQYILDEKTVSGITPFLTRPGMATGKPYRLKANEGKSFQGSIVLGMGFVLAPEEAQALIERNPKNKDVLYPYLNGQDLNSRPDQSSSRWVINFHNWPLKRKSGIGSWKKATDEDKKEWLRDGIVPDDYPGSVAADHPDCLAIVEKNVKPERQRKNPDGRFALRKPLPQRYWHYADKRPALYATIAGMERVLVCPRVTKYASFCFLSPGQVFHDKIYVFPSENNAQLCLLQSNLHEPWAREYSSTLETRLNYSPSDCFETFPPPNLSRDLEILGKRYHEHRRQIMLTRQEGLTKTYNRFHDPECGTHDPRWDATLGEEWAGDFTSDEAIAELRRLHVAMDYAVAAAYGWDDLALEHGFHDTKQGVRFTISEAARREVLGRLLKLNHERYAEEVAQGLHDKKKKKKATARKRKKQGTEPGLFG